MTHGKTGRYTNRGCRCDECRAAQRDALASWRDTVAGTLADGDPRHGTLNGYDNYRCRCGACAAAKAQARKPRATRLA